ncbi:MAG: (deoxy)nucleoside triphosphate pyrophosphohydrolase [Myxococcales bacterium]
MTAPHVRVVAAVIPREDRYLITQRRPTAVLAGLWEFPGGKVEPAESEADALRREVLHRVGVDVQVGACIARRTHDYDGYSVDLALYQATIEATAEPKPVRVADCRWVKSSEFETYRFPAADQATMDLLLGFKR